MKAKIYLIIICLLPISILAQGVRKNIVFNAGIVGDGDLRIIDSNYILVLNFKDSLIVGNQVKRTNLRSWGCFVGKFNESDSLIAELMFESKSNPGISIRHIDFYGNVLLESNNQEIHFQGQPLITRGASWFTGYNTLLALDTLLTLRWVKLMTSLNISSPHPPFPKVNFKEYDYTWDDNIRFNFSTQYQYLSDSGSIFYPQFFTALYSTTAFTGCSRVFLSFSGHGHVRNLTGVAQCNTTKFDRGKEDNNTATKWIYPIESEQLVINRDSTFNQQILSPNFLKNFVIINTIDTSIKYFNLPIKGHISNLRLIDYSTFKEDGDWLFLVGTNVNQDLHVKYDSLRIDTLQHDMLLSYNLLGHEDIFFIILDSNLQLKNYYYMGSSLVNRFSNPPFIASVSMNINSPPIKMKSGEFWLQMSASDGVFNGGLNPFDSIILISGQRNDLNIFIQQANFQLANASLLSQGVSSSTPFFQYFKPSNEIWSLRSLRPNTYSLSIMPPQGFFVNALQQQFLLTKYSYLLTSTTNLSEQTLTAKLYPNPGTGEFVLENLPTNAQVIIYSLQGQVVHQTAAQGQNRLNLNPNLKAGMYLVSIQTANGKQVLKLVINK